MYSICTTTFNCAEKLIDSIESIIKYADTENMEFVICDSQSIDGTPGILNEYRSFFKELKIISKKCFRGVGRQTAFENSSGKYIIQIDLDTIYMQPWRDFILWHKEIQPPFAIQTWGSGIYPRDAIQKVGGWKDLNWAEDLDLWLKLADKGLMKWSNLCTGFNYRLDSKKIPSWRYLRRFRRIRDMMDLHRISLIDLLNHNVFYTPIYLIAYLHALLRKDIVDVRNYDKSTIKKNLIELSIKGLKGNIEGTQFIASYQKSPNLCMVCRFESKLSICERCKEYLIKEGIKIDEWDL